MYYSLNGENETVICYIEVHFKVGLMVFENWPTWTIYASAPERINTITHSFMWEFMFSYVLIDFFKGAVVFLPDCYTSENVNVINIDLMNNVFNIEPNILKLKSLYISHLNIHLEK